MIKKIIVAFILFVIVSLGVLAPAFVVFSQPYSPISPLPGSEEIDTSDPGAFFSNMFRWFIVIAATLSVIKLMLCGFQYMMSESISSKSSAKACIWAILAGLAMILLSVLVLQTINPQLTELPFEGLEKGIQEGMKEDQDPAAGGSPPPLGGPGGSLYTFRYCTAVGCFLEGPFESAFACNSSQQSIIALHGASAITRSCGIGG